MLQAHHPSRNSKTAMPSKSAQNLSSIIHKEPEFIKISKEIRVFTIIIKEEKKKKKEMPLFIHAYRNLYAHTNIYVWRERERERERERGETVMERYTSIGANALFNSTKSPKVLGGLGDDVVV